MTAQTSSSTTSHAATPSPFLAFLEIQNTTVCGSNTIIWEYTGNLSSSLALVVTNDGVDGVELGAEEVSQVLVGLTGGLHLDPSNEYKWSPVAIPAGAFVAVISIPEADKFYLSNTFYVFNGSDHSCLVGSNSAQSTSLNLQLTRTTPGLSSTQAPPLSSTGSISPTIIAQQASAANQIAQIGGAIGGVVGGIICALLAWILIVKRKMMSSSGVLQDQIHAYPVVINSNSLTSQSRSPSSTKKSKPRRIWYGRAMSPLSSRMMYGQPMVNEAIQSTRNAIPQNVEPKQTLHDPPTFPEINPVPDAIPQEIVLAKYTIESKEMKIEMNQLRRDLERVTQERNALEEELAGGDETAPPSYSEPRNGE